MRHMFMFAFAGLLATSLLAGVGDPQTKNDHPWYPGELSCSTFSRLFNTQAELYTRVTGRKVDNEEDKVLASWYWRNINYFHSELVGEDTNANGKNDRLNRDYWGGLFGYGFGLCFDTHHQYSGEIWNLLGANRCRTTVVEGHTSFEVYLKGGTYGDGRWVLLDHDISTVVFLPDNSRMAGLFEINKDMSLLKNGSRARGWFPSGLHSSDAKAYGRIKHTGYVTGYAAVPPLVNLRAGETLRRYVQPGLEDGKTFLYWGVNKNNANIPGPNRDLTWASQPEKMYQSKQSCPGKTIRYANAIYTYKPDFKRGTYKEGVVAEDDNQVTFEWYSPYVIGATPAAASAKEGTGIMKAGCTGGLIVNGKMTCPVEVSVDQGSNWVKTAEAKDGLDLTDTVKGCHQYLLRFGVGAKALADSGLVITTGCQSAPTVIPHVKDGENKVSYESSGQGFVSAGPNKSQAAAHIIAGAMDTSAATLQLEAPRGAPVTAVYAAAHLMCGAPPREATYNIDYSVDGGQTWNPVLKDYSIKRIPPEPGDFSSQAFMQGDVKVDKVAKPVQVRFSCTNNRKLVRVEAQLAYAVPNTSPLKVTYAWKEADAVKLDSHVVAKGADKDAWTFTAGAAPQTFYVEYAAE